MNKLEDLERLANLQKKGILSKEEFEEQKKSLLKSQKETLGQKSTTVYLILAFFFGFLGVHNFYIGSWVKGVIQLILTLLSPLLLFISLFAVFIWVFVEMIVVKKDAKGIPLKPAPILRIVFIVLVALSIFLPMMGVFTIGIISGYTSAMNEYKMNTILDYMYSCAYVAQTKETSFERTAMCSELTDLELPDGLSGDFSFYDAGYGLRTILILDNEELAEKIRTKVVDGVQFSGSENLVYVTLSY